MCNESQEHNGLTIKGNYDFHPYFNHVIISVSFVLSHTCWVLEVGREYVINNTKHCGVRDCDPGTEQGLKKLVGLKLLGWFWCSHSFKAPTLILLNLPSPLSMRLYGTMFSGHSKNALHSILQFPQKMGFRTGK